MTKIKHVVAVVAAAVVLAAVLLAGALGFERSGHRTLELAGDARAGISPIVPAPGPDGSYLGSNGQTWSWSYPSGVLYGAYSARPASGIAGHVYIPSDGPVSYVDTGSTWLPIIPGAGAELGEVAPANVSPFTFLGTSITTSTVAGGVLSAYTNTIATGSQNIQAFDQSYTSTQTITGWVQSNAWNTGSSGIYISDGTKFVVYGWDSTASGANVFVGYYTNATTYSSSSYGDAQAGVFRQATGWRIVPSGSNYLFEISVDGTSWMTVHTESKTAFLTATHCGFFFNPYSNFHEATLLAWHVQ